MAGNPRDSRYRSMDDADRPRPGWRLAIHRTTRAEIERAAIKAGVSASEWLERLACRELGLEPPPRRAGEKSTGG